MLLSPVVLQRNKRRGAEGKRRREERKKKREAERGRRGRKRRIEGKEKVKPNDVKGVVVVDEDPVWQKPVKIEDEEDESAGNVFQR